MPILSGGLNQSRVRAAKEEELQLKFQIRDLEYGVDKTVAIIQARRDAANDILLSSHKQVEFAKEAFEGVKLEFSIGTRTALDVLDAEQELLSAEVSVAQAERDVHFYAFQLKTIMGSFGAGDLNLTIAP